MGWLNGWKLVALPTLYFVRGEGRRWLKFFIGWNSLMPFLFVEVCLKYDITTITNFAKMIKWNLGTLYKWTEF
jgi:hypothetical protein